MCRKKCVHIVKNTYEEARTQSQDQSYGHDNSLMRLHQGYSLSPNMNVLSLGIKEYPPWCILFADDIVLCR